MAGAKVKHKLKQKEGVLRIGGGRFFYPGEAYELTAKEVAVYGSYFTEEKKATGKEEPTGEARQTDQESEDKE